MESPQNAPSLRPIALEQTVYQNETTLFAILAAFAGVFWLVITVATLGIALLYLLFFFILYLFSQSAFISYLKGTAVEITPEQFPDLHARLLDCCQRLAMPEPPRAYLLAADGMLNALATRFLRRNYIVLFSSIVDALEDDPDAVNFYIGHELGHIRRNHLGKGPFLLPVTWLPLIGPAYSRACEYTCDQHGLRCCDSLASATHAVAVLAAGVERWKRLNVQQYLRQVDETGRFWMSFHELTGDYPWLTKRMANLYSLAQGQRFNPPRRSAFAYLLALFVPRMFGGAGGVFIFIAIIGIMAAVALPAYQDYLKRAQGISELDDPFSSESSYGDAGSEDSADTYANEQDDSAIDADLVTAQIEERVTALKPLMDALQAYHEQHGEWPEQFNQLDAALVAATVSEDMALFEEGIVGFHGSSALLHYQQEWIYLGLQTEDEDASYTLVCWSPNIPDAYLPPFCQG